ncbi:ABC transporter permease [Streptomyces sp. NPDC017254]|uniref:ABC transporter permease n=1 Tax=unclassified Streptomyces TaxID=2593676 RepID=UPI0037AC8FF6
MSSLALRGPYWVTVRQYRRTLWLAGGLAAVSLAVIGGLRLWAAQTEHVRVENGTEVLADYNRGYHLLRGAMELLSYGMVALPLVIGALVAGPLIARELESGTYRLSLTQSIGPGAWLRAKLLTATAAGLTATLALMAVYLIGWTKISDTWKFRWSDAGPYEATGPVLVAYVLLGIAVGALVGQLIRRTLVAMAVTGGVVGLVLLVLGAFRWDFLPVTTITGPALENGAALAMPEHGLLVEQGLISTAGQRLPGWFCFTDGTPVGACRTDEPIAAQYLDYHPESHFWPTQLIESGIVLALAALALIAALRVLRARHP